MKSLVTIGEVSNRVDAMSQGTDVSDISFISLERMRVGDEEHTLRAPQDFLGGIESRQCKQPARVYARSLLCHWAIRSLGMTAVAVSQLLGISHSAATRAAYQGEAIAAYDNPTLVERQNA